METKVTLQVAEDFNIYIFFHLKIYFSKIFIILLHCLAQFMPYGLLNFLEGDFFFPIFPFVWDWRPFAVLMFFVMLK